MCSSTYIVFFQSNHVLQCVFIVQEESYALLELLEKTRFWYEMIHARSLPEAPFVSGQYW